MSVDAATENASCDVGNDVDVHQVSRSEEMTVGKGTTLPRHFTRRARRQAGRPTC